MKKLLLSTIVIITLLGSVTSCGRPKQSGPGDTSDKPDSSEPTDPTQAGEFAAKRIQQCVDNYYSRRNSDFDNYVANFDSYNFSTRVAAREKARQILTDAMKKYNEDVEKVEQKNMELRQKFNKSYESLSNFDQGYNRQFSLINNAPDENDNDLPSNVENKIYSIIPPKPAAEKIEKDLVGRKFKDKDNGYFSSSSDASYSIMYGKYFLIADEEIKQFKIEEILEDSDSVYKLNATIHMQQRTGGLTQIVNLDIIYTLDNADDWTLDGIVCAKSMDVVKTGIYTQYINTSKVGSWFYITNNSDATLIVGGYIFRDGFSYRFSKTVSGNSTVELYASSCTIDFVERP